MTMRLLAGDFRGEVEASRARMEAVVAVLNHPGHDQKSHGRKGSGKTGQDALDAVPAELKGPPGGHFGDYEGYEFTGPDGAGDPRALAEYEGLEYQRTNGYLRDPERYEDNPSDIGRELNAETRERIAQIDQTMEVSRTTEDVEVSRVIQEGGSVFGQAWYEGVINRGTTDFDEQDREAERWIAGERPNLTGISWTERAYVSTSANDDHSVAFGQSWADLSRSFRDQGEVASEPVIMTIHVPKGTGGVQLGGMGKTKTPSGREVLGSAEILLQRGLTMTVTADHGIDENGFRRLDVEASGG